ncbi:MAG: hypothetical protein VYA80_06335 [Pseudomonadota bacterium]|nr:hypothetical protein [Pseudomonadota bacterium]
MKKFLLSLGVSLLAVIYATTSIAASPEWNYFEVAFNQGDEDNDYDHSNEATSIGVGLELLNDYHIGLTLTDGENTDEDGGFGDPNGDFDTWQINFGRHPALTANSDLVINFFAGNKDWDDGLFDDGADGDYYGIEIGIRSMYTDKLELFALASLGDYDAGVENADADEGDSGAKEVSHKIGGRYNFDNNFSLGLTLINQDPLLDDSDNNIQFDVRWRFDRFL